LSQISLDDPEHSKNGIQSLRVLAEKVNGDRVAGVLALEEAAVVLDHKIPGVEDNLGLPHTVGRHEAVHAISEITRHDHRSIFRILSDHERFAPDVENDAVAVDKTTRNYGDQVLRLPNLRLGFTPFWAFASSKGEVWRRTE
jgi:hypothetical protein